jgi:hypothetical protein
MYIRFLSLEYSFHHRLFTFSDRFETCHDNFDQRLGFRFVTHSFFILIYFTYYLAFQADSVNSTRSFLFTHFLSPFLEVLLPLYIKSNINYKFSVIYSVVNCSKMLISCITIYLNVFINNNNRKKFINTIG